MTNDRKIVEQVAIAGGSSIKASNVEYIFKRYAEKYVPYTTLDDSRVPENNVRKIRERQILKAQLKLRMKR